MHSSMRSCINIAWTFGPHLATRCRRDSNDQPCEYQGLYKLPLWIHTCLLVLKWIRLFHRKWTQSAQEIDKSSQCSRAWINVNWSSKNDVGSSELFIIIRIMMITASAHVLMKTIAWPFSLLRVGLWKNLNQDLEKEKAFIIDNWRRMMAFTFLVIFLFVSTATNAVEARAMTRNKRLRSLSNPASKPFFLLPIIGQLTVF